ncbi:hypothetical protein ACFOZ5_14655 [Marinobacter lacisalsi]|uniref:Uncharacterized protein n=1 Tax=Marinobacter lacisalsi TaxID=475979 RepID=A0ABV8QKS7_9GAMM
MRDKVKICNLWQGCRPRTLVLGSLVFCLASPIAIADDDLGVTMRMVTDDDLTGAVTREIELPEPVPGRDSPGSSGGAENNRNTDNPFMGDGPPGQGRNRPEFNPSEVREEASDNARERRSDARRSASPDDRPGNSGRPDRPGRPDHAGPPDDRPGNSNRP